MTKVKRGKGGNVIKIAVDYDDGGEEECRWSDNDIVIIGKRVGGREEN